MMGAWRIAVRNLRRNARRNVVTGSAIAFGLAGLLLVGGYILRVEEYLATSAIYMGHVGHVAIYKKDALRKWSTAPEQFSLSAPEQGTIAQTLSTDDGVEFVGRYLQGVGLASNGCKSVPVNIQGIEPAADRFVREHPRVLAALPELSKPYRGVDLAAGAVNATSLSLGLARALGKSKVSSELGSHPARLIDCSSADAAEEIGTTATVQLMGRAFDGSFSATEGTIVGMHTTGLAETEDSSVVTTLAVLQQLYDTDAVTYMAAYLRVPRDLGGVARSLQERLRDRGVLVDVYPFSDEAVSLYYFGTHNMLMVLGIFVSIVISLVVALSIVNSMTITTLERTHEIGTFRSVGFTRSNVMGLFMREGMLLALLGMIGGAILAVSTSTVVNALNIRYTPPGIAGDMQFMLQPNLVLGLGVALGMVAVNAAALLVAVRGRVRMPIAELNAAVAR